MFTSGGFHRLTHHCLLHPLHSSRTTSALGHLEDAMSKTKLLPDRVFYRPAYLGTAKRLVLGAYPIESGHDSRSDHRAFEFREHRRHLHHRSSEWSSGVD